MFKSKIKMLCKKLLNEKTRNGIRKLLNFIFNPPTKMELLRMHIRRKCISYFQKYGNEEQKSLIPFLNSTLYFDFPYEWTKKYDSNGIVVYREKDFPYVIRNGKKLFGTKTMSNDEWKGRYNSILLEQDIESPHRYILPGREPDENSVFADIGAAEGFLALDFIDKVKKVYLFECDQEWIDALKMTFRPWEDKVEIVNMYVSDITSAKTVALDDFFNDKDIDYIKADIEGFEEQMLRGAANIFEHKIKKCLLCCYHRDTSEKDFIDFLNPKGFDIDINKGLMIWVWSKKVLGEPLRVPFVRHGVMYAEKN